MRSFYIRTALIFLILTATTAGSFAGLDITSEAEKRQYRITGRIIDNSSDEPMAYVTISLMHKSDSSILTGTVSSDDGSFTLETKEDGNFLLLISFMGYEDKHIPVEIVSGDKKTDLGEIRLKPSANMIDEVTVEGNKYAMDYEIDKKIIHVSKQHTNISGTAVDALQYAPSVQIDIEGNVALRGNSNFTVLIDGKPSILDATEALEQIPASSIKDIEIITNPSAKYDPEGTAGIINIITQKRSLNGLSGIAHINGGLDNKYGGDLLVNYKTDHFKFFISGDYNKRTYPGSMIHDNRFYAGDTTYYVQADGERERSRERYSLRAGAEWHPDENNTLSLSARAGSRSSKSINLTEYKEWNTAEPDVLNYLSDERGERGGDFFSLQTNYTYQWDTEHQFDTELNYYQRDGSDETINQLENNEGNIQSGQRSVEYGPASGIRYRINYKQAFREEFRIEAGLQGRYRDSEEINEIYNLDTVTREYELQENFSHEVSYMRNIHAGYGLVSGEIREMFGYQLGLRSEYTKRDIQLLDTGDEFLIDRWDFFPTTHISYNLNESNQIMASYSRRIDRPRGWFLEPFVTWVDAYNVRQGNPALQPEYTNAMEVAYQKEFGKHAASAELFYRTTDNNIERIRRVYREDIMMSTFENVGKEFSLGLELMLNAELFKWWEADITGNLYDYRIKGELDGRDFDDNRLTWNIRWNNSFRLWENTVVQFNPSYQGPEIEPQERESAYFRVDGSIRQSFLDKKLKITMQVRDIFGTSKYESYTETPELYNYRLYTYKSPIVILNLSYTINNYRDRSGKGNGSGGDIIDDEM
ncbi:MAG: TonB-dependent receptor domain-containing protein [Bacteroidota bacterium]